MGFTVLLKKTLLPTHKRVVLGGMKKMNHGKGVSSVLKNLSEMAISRAKKATHLVGGSQTIPKIPHVMRRVPIGKIF